MCEEQFEKDLEQSMRECNKRKINCHATGYIFEKKADSYRSKLLLLNFLGVIVPAGIGMLVISYGTDFIYLNNLLFISSIALFIQFILFVWSLFNNWQDIYAYSKKSSSINYNLAKSFDELVKNPPKDKMFFQLEYTKLITEDNKQNDIDEDYYYSEEEKRRGMRAALRIYRIECAGCGEIPKSLEPSNCDVCGNYVKWKVVPIGVAIIEFFKYILEKIRGKKNE